MNSLGRLMLGDCWIGWDSVVRTHVFLTVWFLEGVARSFAICCHHGTCLFCSMVKSEAENVMEAVIEVCLMHVVVGITKSDDNKIG